MPTFYVIDKMDRLATCGGEWDEFALRNGGSRAVARRITGYPLWDFVADTETASYLNGIFFWCRRRGQTFETTYRCDAPQERRLFRMTVIPTVDAELRVEHALVGAVGMKVTPFRDRDCTSRCSACGAVRIGGEWIEPFNRPEERYFPAGYTVCQPCKTAALEALREQGGGQVLRMGGRRA